MLRTPAPLNGALAAMKNRPRSVELLVFSLLFVIAPAAHADIGVPMLFITFPATVAALVPVIALETWRMAIRLGSPWQSHLKPVTLANVVSTIVGLPITWVALTVLQMVSGGGAAHGINTLFEMFLAVTWQAPWLIPYESDLYWMMPVATIVLLGPFLIASYYIEAAIVTRLEAQRSKETVWSAVLNANLFSYALLLAVSLAWLIWALAEHGS